LIHYKNNSWRDS